MQLRSITGALALALVAAAPAAAQLPTVAVEANTYALPDLGQHRGVTVTASCASGTKLVGGGGYLRNATDPAVLPTNGLVLGGTTVSNGTSPIDTAPADGALDLSSWMVISNYTGQSQAGNQATSFALCATAGGPSQTVVAAASRVGANATQEVNPPNLTTATCPSGSRLIGGGARTLAVGQISDGTTMGSTGNLKPLGNYPSDSSGVPAADGATDSTSWTAYGSAGAPAAADEVLAFALCSKDPATPPVRVARVDVNGPVAQPGTTPIQAQSSCPTGTRLLGGGYKVDERVGATSGLQPQQGYHMRGSYPSVDGAGVEAADGATNLTTWTSLVQAGGQTLAADRQMTNRAFALCGTAPVAVPDLVLTVSAAPSPVVVGEPLTYTYSLRSAGGDAGGVVLSDTLPAGVTLVSVDDQRCAMTAGALRCALGTLAAGATSTVKVVVRPTSTGTVTNDAAVVSNAADAAPADNEASVDVEVRAVPKAATSLGLAADRVGRTGEGLVARADLRGGTAPSGAIEFMVFAPGDEACARPLARVSTTVAGAGAYVSAPFVADEPGRYQWTATYAGDAENLSSSSACGDVSVLVKATPTLALAGAAATLAGGSALTGTLTFRVFAGPDALCATPLAAFDVAVAGAGSYGYPAYVAPGPGTYRWTVTYGGDERNVPAGPTDCGASMLSVLASSPPPVATPDPPSTPSNVFRVRGTRLSGAGAVTVRLEAPGAGRFVATARGLRRVSVSKRTKGALSLKLEPTAATLRTLRREGRVRVRVTVRFTPTGGEPRTRTVTVTLKRA